MPAKITTKIRILKYYHFIFIHLIRLYMKAGLSIRAATQMIKVIHISLVKQQFVVSHRNPVLQETENT
jgi:hypothetical protein